MSLNPSPARALGQLAFRVLFSLIFLVAGASHLLFTDKVVGRLLKAPGGLLPSALSPKLLVILSGAALFAGGLALAIGLLTRWAAIGLALVLVLITVTVQFGNPEGLGPLFKNVALLGGLLHWALEGAGRLSLDHWLRSRPSLRPAATGAALALLLAVGLPAQAGPPGAPQAGLGGTARPARVLLLVQQGPQLAAALATGQQSLAGRGFPASEVEVLVCGPAITSLLRGAELEPKLRAARRAGVRVVACGLTLSEKGIDRSKVSPEVTVVENGLVEALERQAEGFLSVEL